MITPDSHSNMSTSLVATAPSPALSGTTLTLTTGDVVAQHFPTSGSFNAFCWPTGKPTWATAEIVRCTWVSGDQYNIVRAQEGTTAIAIGIGYMFMLSDNAKLFTDIESIAQIGAVPYYIAAAETWYIPSSYQVNNWVPITNDGLITNDGFIAELV